MAAAVHAWLWECVSMDAGMRQANPVDLLAVLSLSGMADHQRDAAIIREVVLGVERFLAANPAVRLTPEDKSVLIITMFRMIKEDSWNKA